MNTIIVQSLLFFEFNFLSKFFNNDFGIFLLMDIYFIYYLFSLIVVGWLFHYFFQISRIDNNFRFDNKIVFFKYYKPIAFIFHSKMITNELGKLSCKCK